MDRHPRLMKGISVGTQLVSAGILASSVAGGGLYLWANERKNNELKDDYKAWEDCNKQLDKGTGCSFEQQDSMRRAFANEALRCMPFPVICAEEIQGMIRQSNAIRPTPPPPEKSVVARDPRGLLPVKRRTRPKTPKPAFSAAIQPSVLPSSLPIPDAGVSDAGIVPSDAGTEGGAPSRTIPLSAGMPAL
jgi:hypothetical protein